MIEVGQLRRDADLLMERGESLAALRLFVAVLKRVPQDYTARIGLADALARSDHKAEAAAVYAAAARNCTEGGLLPMAIVAIRAIDSLGLDGYQGIVDSLIDHAAKTYARGSERIGAVGARINIQYPEGVSVAPKELRAELTVAELAAISQKVGADLSQVGAMPPRLQPVALLSKLSAARLAGVIRALWVHRLPPGHVLMKRGERGSSCFIVASGLLRVSAPDELGVETELAQLGMGTLVGEMALISGSARLANVTVLESSDILELGPDALRALGDELDQLAPVLDQLAKHRWMHNLLEQSPLFAVFEEKERKAILQRCSAYEVPAGQALFEQGRDVRGIYLLMRGDVKVERLGGMDAHAVFSKTFPAGTTFGIYENLTNEPADATASATRPSTVLFLSKESVQRLFKAVPAFKDHLKKIARARAQELKAADDVADAEQAPPPDDEEGDTVSDRG